MKIKVVQDSVIFISGLTIEELEDAKRFAPESLTLYKKEDDSEKKAPVCGIAYADAGSVTEHGVVYDSTTDDGFLCKTILCIEGNHPHCTSADKKKCVSEQYASLVLNMNDLEKQIKAALKSKAEDIAIASKSVEVVSF
jgi:hypothetical protein